MVNGKLRVLGMASAAAALALGGASIAFASGPAKDTGNGNGSTGRGTLQADCSNFQSYTVSVPNPDGARGVAQIVAEQGHFIPAGGEFTIVDETQGTTLETDTFADTGHKNQDTIECTGTIFTGLASDFFGTDLPPGVNAGDTITGSFDVNVIPRP